MPIGKKLQIMIDMAPAGILGDFVFNSGQMCKW